MDYQEKLIIETFHSQMMYALEEEKASINSDSTNDEDDELSTFYYNKIVEAEENIIKGKKIEAIIGITILIPPLLGAVAFILNLFDLGGNYAEMSFLSSNWTCDFSNQGGGGMSAAPIFLGLMALAGVYLIRDNIKYLISEKKTLPKA